MQKESIERSAPENQYYSLVNRILFLLEFFGILRDSEKPLIVKNLNWQKEKKL